MFDGRDFHPGELGRVRWEEQGLGVWPGLASQNIEGVQVGSKWVLPIVVIKLASTRNGAGLFTWTQWGSVTQTRNIPIISHY